jgi:hypothetical protein
VNDEIILTFKISSPKIHVGGKVYSGISVGGSDEALMGEYRWLAGLPVVGRSIGASVAWTKLAMLNGESS